MLGLLKAMGVVKAALAIGTLTAVTAFAATQVSLPAASDGGQAHASAAASNAEAPGSGKAATVADQLAANKTRLLATLNAVLARLQANTHVNSHATDAIQKVIDRITNSDTGLNRASAAVTNGGGSSDHPSASNHPGQP
jgi:hypothetical protein